MIFRRQLVRSVLAGRKTQTRRKVKPGEERCRYEVGRSYAVQSSRGGSGIVRVRVTDVRREFLHEISFEDARREGFASREEFFNHWRALYKEGPVGMTIPVWVITFELDRQHVPRLLDRRSERGYTDKSALALAQEPEAVDSTTLERFVQENNDRFGTAKTERSLDERVRELLRAQERGEDVSRQLAGIRRRVESAERSRSGRAA